MLLKLIAIATFPGIIAHEFAHELFCHMTGVKVRKVCYLRFGNPAGYVIHEMPQNFVQSFFITIGPFLFGNFLAAAFFLLIPESVSLRSVILFWLGASVAMNCLPSKGDAKSLWRENWEQLKINILSILGIPVTLFVWILSRFNLLFLRISYVIALFMLMRSFIYQYF